MGSPAFAYRTSECKTVSLHREIGRFTVHVEVIGRKERLADIRGCDVELSGIAGAFMRAGVAQVIGPAVQINDREAGAFAERFYGFLFKGGNAGEALLMARRKLAEDNSAVTPLLYRLYGDPCFAIGYKKKSANADGPEKKNITIAHSAADCYNYNSGNPSCSSFHTLGRR